MRRAMASGSPATWSGKFRSTIGQTIHRGRSLDHLHHRRLAVRLGQKRCGAEPKELRRVAKRERVMGSSKPV